MSFFVNPPLATLSGSLTPVEAMPHWLQPVTVLNPIRHFGIITRGALMKERWARHVMASLSGAYRCSRSYL